MANRLNGCEEPSDANLSYHPEVVAEPLHLEFITITDRPESARAAYSQVVRQQAMLAFLRAQREDLTHGPKKKIISSKVVPLTAQKPFSKFKLSTWSSKKNKVNKTISASNETDRRSNDKGLKFQVWYSASATYMFKSCSYLLQSVDTALHGYGGLPIPATSQTQRLLYHCM